MKIAIQAADLDAERIDGTRVYILNLLKYFGQLDPKSQFLIYHKNKFNPELKPPEFFNYKILKKSWPLFWTQLRLTASLWRQRPDVLWMPMHNIPYFKPKKVKTVVTIHDLAFKYFPECFTKIELAKLNFLAGMAIRNSDKIITISESSKKDILKFYPNINEEKIKVIYHGFDREIFAKERDLKKEDAIKKQININGQYILYVGAIQPRKNLEVLISAFEILKAKHCHSGLDSESSVEFKNNSLDSRFCGNDRSWNNLKLVLAGEKAWMWEDVFSQIEKSPWKNDIITPGKIKFQDLGHLMRGAQVFCFPSLYEGFGIPVLEAFAARVPVVCAGNSSLPEVGGEAAAYFDGKNPDNLAEKLKSVLESENDRKDLIKKGLIQAEKFSWEKCARETLECIKN